jgi:hypothetical protein
VKGILRGLSSRTLPCRCLVGVYETYGGEVVGIVDAKSDSCNVTAHEKGKQVPDPSSESNAEAIDSFRRSHRD